jgi:hypothetical protein
MLDRPRGVTEKTLRALSTKFARDLDYVAELRLPWRAYFAD